MSSSRLGILFLIVVGVLASTNCGYYNRVMSRKDLVDGSVAYRERKFAEAEAYFRLHRAYRKADLHQFVLPSLPTEC